MQIVSAPPAYSPAYRDAIFGITADPAEVVTLDIYGCSQAASGGQTVLTGKKRVTGMDGYDINVANYAKRLLSVNPLAGGECGLFKPEGRMVDISVRSGDVSEGTTLNAGIFPYEEFKFLSDAPSVKTIFWNGCDELSFLAPACNLAVRIELAGKGGEASIIVVSTAVEAGVYTFFLSTDDLERLLVTKGLGDLGDFDRMRVGIMKDLETVMAREYDIVAPTEGSANVCWWNSHGQVDYCAMKNMVGKSVKLHCKDKDNYSCFPSILKYFINYLVR